MSQDIQEILDLAREKFINGNYAEAEKLISQLLIKSAQIPELYQMLATIYYNRGQFNKAIKTFKRALEIDPTYLDASVGLSIILNDLGRYDEAKKIYYEAQDLLDRRTKRSDNTVNEKLAAKHEELADMYFNYGQFQDSIDFLHKALSLSSRKAELTMRLAECHFKLKQLDKAVSELRSLIKEYPQFLPAKVRLASLLYESNRVAEAVEIWEQVLAKDPHNVDALKGLRIAQSSDMTEFNM